MAIRKVVVAEGGSSKVNGLAESFARAVQRNRRALLRIATAMVGPDEAEDVVQDTLLKCWRLTREEPEDWASWLFRCTVNQAKQALAERRGAPRLLSVDAILDNEEDED